MDTLSYPASMTSSASPFHAQKNGNTQLRPEKMKRFRRFVDNFWLWEISTCFLSLIFLGIIFFILARFQNQSILTWTFNWRINSVIATFATLTRLAITVPIVAGLSQLKWLWFRERHRLRDIDIFDQASRDPVGAWRLLKVVKLK